MFVIKNALRCISRSKGRNILIGIIVLVIATSACIGLSIRQAAESSKETTLEGLSVTASISYDFQASMNDIMQKPEKENLEDGEMPSFDKSDFKDMMSSTSSLTLDEYKTYATAESVKDFYYSMSVSVNGSDAFEPVSTSSESESDSSQAGNPFGGSGFGGMSSGGMSFGSSSDFQIVGYSSEDAMTDFINGTATLSDGDFFEESTTEMTCIISSELATYNNIAVGDIIMVTNPENEEETYTLTVTGLFTDSSSGSSLMGRGPSMKADPVNMIYMSYPALSEIVAQSETASEDTALRGSLDATYVFADVESYEAFDAQARELGLAEEYTISSQDLTAYESSLTPLETLSTMAGWFLIVILIIGAIILIVLNIFNVRERKYEIGVLTAMGMKKGKVASQFLAEIFTVTMVAVIFGIVIGAVCAVPVTNALLENQVEAQQSQFEQIEGNFGRFEQDGNMPDMNGMGTPSISMDSFKDFGESIGEIGTQYITEIDSAMNFTVVLQMLGIAVLLTLISGMVAVLFVMRYDPLKILANRD